MAVCHFERGWPHTIAFSHPARENGTGMIDAWAFVVHMCVYGYGVREREREIRIYRHVRAQIHAVQVCMLHGFLVLDVLRCLMSMCGNCNVTIHVSVRPSIYPCTSCRFQTQIPLAPLLFPPAARPPPCQEFTKGGLVKGGLAIYVLSLYHYC